MGSGENNILNMITFSSLTHGEQKPDLLSGGEGLLRASGRMLGAGHSTFHRKAIRAHG